MKVLELFCGTKSFAKVAYARGHETFTIDINPRFEPEMTLDIGQLEVGNLPVIWQHPDIIWASPPCTTFSVAAMHVHYWSKKGVVWYPNNEKARKAAELVRHTLGLIKDLGPRYFFIENPVGLLRHQPYMKGYKRRTVTYCQYGHSCRKPTDIWTNLYAWRPRRMCKPRDDCHVSSPNSSNRGVQDMRPRNPITRGIVPSALCEEILIACERAWEALLL